MTLPTSSPIKQAVLLVGGLGTRLRPLTLGRPKALIPLLNRPLLSYQFDLLARYGVRDIILAVCYHAEQLERELGDGQRWGVRLRYVAEQQPLGTAGALKNVEALIAGPFLAFNGDVIMDFDLGALMATHLQGAGGKDRAILTLCLRRVEDISAFGLIRRDREGRVTAFLEKRRHDETGQNTINAGVYVMDPRIFEYIPAGREYSSEHELFPGLLRAGETVLGHLPQRWNYWNDVGRVDTYLQANRDLLEGALSWVQVPPAEGVAAPSLVGEGVTIGPGAQVGPYVTVGDGVRIGERAVVRDSILWPGAQVGARARVEASVLGTGAIVPDNMRLSHEVLVGDV